jgi:hypothetical protein
VDGEACPEPAGRVCAPAGNPSTPSVKLAASRRSKSRMDKAIGTASYIPFG